MPNASPRTIRSVAPSIAIAFQIASPSRCIGTETSSTRGARPRQRVGGRAHGGVDVGLGDVRDPEALGQHADPQAVGADLERRACSPARTTPIWRGSSPSSPAIAPSISAQSATVRAIGPMWSSVSSIGKIPV